MQKINLHTWHRKEYFNFFAPFSKPFFSITTEVDCTQAYPIAKAAGVSFFAWYLYQSIRAANQIEEFRYRLIDGEVYLLDEVHAGSTIAREDGSFGFSFVPMAPDFETFRLGLQAEIAAVQNSEGLRFTSDTGRDDLIHYTALPWVRFTSFSHAHHFGRADSIPKIAFGKLYQRGDQLLMPVSIDVHHGFVDGLHVGKFMELFQGFLDRERP